MAYYHGLKKHPFYPRWSGMIQRCYNSNDPDFAEHGGKSIGVAKQWDRRNKDGVTNFIRWAERQAKKLPKGTDLGLYKILRKDKEKNFSPRNCYLGTSCEFAQKRPATILTVELVVQIRQYMRANPYRTFVEVACEFDIKSAMVIYRCVTGLTWKNVDSIEAPFNITQLREEKRIQDATRC